MLAGSCEVTLAGPGRPERSHPAFRVASFDGRLEALVGEHDVVVCFGYLLDKHPEIRSARHLVVDLYDPFTLENLHMHPDASLPEQHRIAARDRAVQMRLLEAGDVFLCASERQRDFWLGWLAAAGRVNPYVHQADAAFAGLVRVVPFGVPEEPPAPGPPRLRGVVPGIGPDDLVLLWGGGLWNWFDPLTLIRAVAAVAGRLPQLRLVFPAAQSPGAETGPMRMPAAAVRLADELGLTGRTVFFGTGWVPYEERGSLLLEADVGVSLHAEDIETRFSFRTRVLDYLWAGLPVLTTGGDTLAELVAGRDLGEVVPYGDVDRVAEALLRLQDRRRLAGCAERSRAAAQEFRWSRVAAPLVEYCRDPRPAPDRAAPPLTLNAADAPPVRERGRLWRRVRETLREEGPLGVARRAARYARRAARG